MIKNQNQVEKKKSQSSSKLEDSYELHRETEDGDPYTQNN